MNKWQGPFTDNIHFPKSPLRPPASTQQLYFLFLTKKTVNFSKIEMPDRDGIHYFTFFGFTYKSR